MKHYVKRILGLVCTFALLISLNPVMHIPVAASEMANEVVISEYDYITAVRSMSNDEIEALEISQEEVELIRSDAIESELLSRKEKTDAELALQYGYSEEDIALLREYDGESIQENVELAALTGTLTIRKPTVITATSSRVVVRVVWRWDHCPVVNATDVFAVYWDSTFGSLNGNMRINISDSYHTVTYNLYDTYFTQTQSFTQVSPYSAAKVEFSMQDVSGEAWANKGEARLYFEAAEGSAALTEMDMIFAYGHTLVLLSPSISFPVSGGISFGWRTDEADRRSGYVSVADKTWVNN